VPRLRRANARRLLAALGVLAAVMTLAACQKPTPGVTLQSGSTSTVLKPQTYCFDAKTKDCRVAASGNVGTLHAAGGGSILVDVPRTIADGYWQVRSATQSKDGTFKTLTADGTQTAIVHGRHSARVQVPFGSGDYYLIVAEAPQGANKATGSWVARIVVTS
jgi:hypothetical protein